MALYAGDMARLAVQQRATGQQILAQHRPDQAGLCVACGRISPCEPRLRGQELVDRYSGWLAAPPPVTPPPFAHNGARR